LGKYVLGPAASVDHRALDNVQFGTGRLPGGVIWGPGYVLFNPGLQKMVRLERGGPPQLVASFQNAAKRVNLGEPSGGREPNAGTVGGK
jgi:hypothetical protein